jgi:hypothetical protein
MKSRKYRLFGEDLTLAELRDRAPDLGSLAGFSPCRLLDGPEHDTLAVEVRTGSGFEYTVVPDRAMNICRARYCGVPLDWSSGTGIVAPAFFESAGWKWLRSFNGGLVHTCGLDNVGSPALDETVGDDNRDFGGHGRISSTPARGVSWRFVEVDGMLCLEVAGAVHAISATEENVLLERSVLSELGGTRLFIRDRVTNLGCQPAPVFLLYHCNFGYPLLSEHSILRVPHGGAVDVGGAAVYDLEQLGPPRDGSGEQVIYPTVREGDVRVELINPSLTREPFAGGLGIYLSYRTAELPCLTIWKKLLARHYVLGIEPGTCRVEGRVRETRAGRALVLGKDETRSFTLEIGVCGKEGA